MSASDLYFVEHYAGGEYVCDFPFNHQGTHAFGWQLERVGQADAKTIYVYYYRSNFHTIYSGGQQIKVIANGPACIAWNVAIPSA